MTVAPHAEPWIEADLRKVAAAACAGLVAGVLVNAVGSRLIMMLLAQLNSAATGVVSDDGFLIGRFDVAATLNLSLIATALGVVGGLIFLAVRRLRLGPRWFQTASITVGPAVVVGAALVHTDGVDFRILQPAWLAIALFVALPGVYAFAVSRLADRWLAEGSWFCGGPRWRLVALAPLILAAPALPLLLLGIVARLGYRFVPALQNGQLARLAPMLARGGLAAIFVVAAVDLIRDVRALL